MCQKMDHRILKDIKTSTLVASILLAPLCFTVASRYPRREIRSAYTCGVLSWFIRRYKYYTCTRRVPVSRECLCVVNANGAVAGRARKGRKTHPNPRNLTCRSDCRREIFTLSVYRGILLNKSGRMRWRIKLGKTM